MNILFITSSRIGDAVLSTGLLNYISQKHPEARVTVVCGPLAVSLFEGYPNLANIVPLKKKKHHWHWIDLWWQAHGKNWDIIIDLRNSAVSRLLRAQKKYMFGNHIDSTLHKVEQNARVMELSEIPAPKLWFTDQQKRDAEKMIPDGSPVIGVGPTANWAAKTWPAERFIEIIQFLTSPDGRFPNARVAVFAAPGEEDIARTVLASVPAKRQLDIIAKCDPGTAAAALARCDFYIGNDSGLMHCAAAAGVRTLGLFGPSYPSLYRPWGPNAYYVSTPETFDELTGYAGYNSKTAPCLMNSLTVEMVKRKFLN